MIYTNVFIRQAMHARPQCIRCTIYSLLCMAPMNLYTHEGWTIGFEGDGPVPGRY